MAPIVHGLEVEYLHSINFVYLDVDDPENDAIKRDLGYRVQPHFYLVDAEGNIIQQWLGSVKAEEFRAVFEDALMN